MSYSVVDLVEKAIALAELKGDLYHSIEEDVSKSLRLKTVAGVLKKLSEKNAAYYKSILDGCVDCIREEMDIFTYDKISALIEEFKRMLYKPEINDIKELLSFSLDLDERVLALYVNMQGRVSTSDTAANSLLYGILAHMIERKKSDIEDIKKFLH